VDFKNVVLIMTSNIGADRITNQSSFGFEKRDEEVSYEKMKETLKGELERYFRPEFLNRVDEVVVFHKLNRRDLVDIVVLETKKIAKRLKEHGVTLELTEAAKEYLIDKGTDEKFGARPLRRAIGHLIEDPLSEGILRGEYAGRNRITADVQEEEGKKKLIFRADNEPEKSEQPAAAAAAAEATGDST
jgi:ATP-dependent Clp protease ATP-binding subunit ClpC